MRVLFLALLLAATSGAALNAHDMWIEPSSFTPAVGDLVQVRLRIGHAGASEPVVRQPQRIVRFAAVPPEGPEQALLGLDGSDPAGFLRPSVAGSHTLVYVSNDARSELAADKFEAYLAEEGLQHILEQRRRQGNDRQPGREIYSRSLKSLLRVATTPLVDRAVGLPLELILTPPVARDGTTASDSNMRLQLRFRGDPLAAAYVDARPLDRHQPVLAARSDEAGEVELELTAGAWLVTAVHMIADPSGGAEWRSFWTALTFELADDAGNR